MVFIWMTSGDDEDFLACTGDQVTAMKFFYTVNMLAKLFSNQPVKIGCPVFPTFAGSNNNIDGFVKSPILRNAVS